MKWIYYIIITILFAMNILLVFIIMQERLQTQQRLEHAYIYNMHYNLLFDNISMHYKYDNHKIEDFYLRNEKNEQIKFSDLLDNNYKLFLIYSNQNCLSCINYAIEELLAFTKTIDSNRVFIIGEYTNIRELKAHLKEKERNIPVYFAKENSISILKKENVPYLFLMKNNMITNFLFIPTKEIQEYSKKYYDIIRERFFINSEQN